jgi:hypothetical protein
MGKSERSIVGTFFRWVKWFIIIGVILWLLLTTPVRLW